MPGVEAGREQEWDAGALGEVVLDRAAIESAHGVRSTNAPGATDLSVTRPSNGMAVAKGHNKRKLRVCVLAACPFPANHGTPGSIREMSEALAELGHDVHIVTYPMGDDIPLAGALLHRIPRVTREKKIVVGPTIRRPVYDFLMIFKALQIIRRHRPHLLHAHGYEAALVAAACRFVTGLPIVYSGHNTMSDELASYDFIRPRWLANSLARVLDAVVPRLANRCVPHSQALAEFFEDRGVGGRTEQVVNFGIDLRPPPRWHREPVRRKYGLQGPVVLYAGVLNRFQRLDLLYGAMARVAQVHPNAKLLLAVTLDNARQIALARQQAAAAGIAQHLVVTEPLDLEGVRRCLTACDVAAIPRPAAPGFPIKLLNYMAASKPCVMFASSASRIRHREHALLVAPDTSEALAGGILELLGDDLLRRAIGERGRQFAIENHDRRRTAAQMAGVYARTLKQALR